MAEYTDLPPHLAEIMGTYAYDPNLSLEEWYAQYPTTPPPTQEVPSGPPSTWGIDPVVRQAEGQDYYVEQPVQEGITTRDEYVEQQMIQQGFVQGEYGGWYKPTTKQEKTIPGPITPKEEPTTPVLMLEKGGLYEPTVSRDVGMAPTEGSAALILLAVAALALT